MNYSMKLNRYTVFPILLNHHTDDGHLPVSTLYLAYSMNFNSQVKHTVAIDIGGTIEDTWFEKQLWFIENVGIDVGRVPLDRDDVIAIDGIGISGYEKMRHLVYADHNIYKHRMLKGALAGIISISKRNNIVLLTTREISHKDATEHWLSKNNVIDHIFDVVYLGNSECKTKWCVKNKALFLVDDDSRHFNYQYSNSSLTCILLQEHSQLQQDNFVKIAKNWNEVEAIVLDNNV